MDGDFTIGDWVVRPERLCVYRPGKTVHVTPKSMAVLLLLVRADGGVVARNDILDEVWPGAAVTDDVLTHCIVELRKAFEDSAQAPQVIETIPKKGFRLVADVAPIAEQSQNRWPGWGIAITGLAVILAAAVSLWHVVREPSPLPAPVDGPTLAVLPFADLSPGGEQASFADGLTDELITQLALLEGLQVTGRASSFNFRGRDGDIESIGEQLGVGHILAGSVRRADSELRVTARLINVETGFHVWTATYERRVEDWLDVQEKIAEAVASELSVGLGVGDEARTAGGTDNLAAYEEYLAGNFALFGPGADWMTAVNHYQRAIELDPDYALAWAELAKSCQFAAEYWGEGEPYRLAERRDRAIEQAIKLAPDSPQVVATLASLKIFQGQYREARLVLDDLNRRYEGRDIPTALVNVDLSLKMGRLDDAYRAIGYVVRRDPLNPLVSTYLSHLYLLLGRADDALAEVERAIRNGHQNIGLMSSAGPMALATRRREEIQKWLKRYVESLGEEWLDPYTFEHAVLDRLDDRDALLEFLRKFQSRGVTDPGRDFRVITWAAYLGDDAMALGSLRRAPDPWFFWNPLLKRVRASDEFKQILIDTGIVDYWREFGWGDFCSPTEGNNFECR